MFDDKTNELFKELNLNLDAAKARDMLVDSVTGLPTLNFVLEKVRQLSLKNSVAVLVVNISSIVNIEQVYGQKNYDSLLVHTASMLSAMRGKQLRKSDLIATIFPRSDSFLVFLTSPRTSSSRIDGANLEAICGRVEHALCESVKDFSPVPVEYIGFMVGFSVISDHPQVCVERSLFSAVREAEMAGVDAKLKERHRLREDLKKIIDHEEVRTVFQPIIDLETSRIVGYEALTRGPQKSQYEMPAVLFSLADSYGFSDQLEWVCIIKAVINFNLNMNFIRGKIKEDDGAERDLLLFLNTDPKTYHATSSIVGRFSEILKKYYISPKNIVLEITERNAIEDFQKFREVTAELKKLGFSIAIDDAGAGYSSLQSIAELRPKYLKFDMSLVRGIDADFIKQELLRTLMDFARKTDSIVVAEGIETEAEYRTVKLLGAHLGQGYYFARPNPQFIETLQIF